MGVVANSVDDQRSDPVRSDYFVLFERSTIGFTLKLAE